MAARNSGRTRVEGKSVNDVSINVNCLDIHRLAETDTRRKCNTDSLTAVKSPDPTDLTLDPPRDDVHNAMLRSRALVVVVVAGQHNVGASLYQDGLKYLS